MDYIPRECSRCGYPILILKDMDGQLVYIDGNSGNYEIIKDCPGCDYPLEWALEISR
jgi:hypothetical protein